MGRVFVFWGVLLLSLLPHSVHAAAWTQEEGGLQVILNNFAYISDTYVDNDGTEIDQSTFFKNEINPYIEYALTDEVTIGASPRLRYISQRIGGNKESTVGLAEVDVFVRKQLWKGDFSVFSGQALVKVPGPFDEDNTLPLADQQFDYKLSGLFGHSFEHNDRYHYVSVEAGYRHRAKSPVDEFQIDTVLGYKLSEKYTFLAEGSGIFSVEDDTPTDTLISTSSARELIKAQGSLLYAITEATSVQVGLSYDLYARNTGRGLGAVVSLWFDF